VATIGLGLGMPSFVSGLCCCCFSGDADAMLCTLHLFANLESPWHWLLAAVEDHDTQVSQQITVCVGMSPTRPVYNATPYNAT
jgi:hypothetical protein